MGSGIAVGAISLMRIFDHGASADLLSFATASCTAWRTGIFVNWVLTKNGTTFAGSPAIAHSRNLPAASACFDLASMTHLKLPSVVAVRPSAFGEFGNGPTPVFVSRSGYDEPISDIIHDPETLKATFS